VDEHAPRERHGAQHVRQGVRRLRLSPGLDPRGTTECEHAGAPANLQVEVGSAKEYAGDSYDLVTLFDCLHDMGDPAGAARHVRPSLKPDGAWMIVEPFAHDRLEDNLNPVGRLYYPGSTLLCVPTWLA
jgi:hypothetical protein